MCALVRKLVEQLSQSRDNLTPRDLDYITSLRFRDMIRKSYSRGEQIDNLKLTALLDPSQNDACLYLIKKLQVNGPMVRLSEEDKNMYCEIMRKLLRSLDELYPVGSHLAITDTEKAWRSITDRTEDHMDYKLSRSVHDLILGHCHFLSLDLDNRQIYIISPESKETLINILSTINSSIPLNVWDYILDYRYSETSPLE